MKCVRLWKHTRPHTSNAVSLQAYGGDGIIQRIKRVAFDARSTIMVSSYQAALQNDPHTVEFKHLFINHTLDFTIRFDMIQKNPPEDSDSF